VGWRRCGGGTAPETNSSRECYERRLCHRLALAQEEL
jgi:hypothetical protein